MKLYAEISQKILNQDLIVTGNKLNCFNLPDNFLQSNNRRDGRIVRASISNGFGFESKWSRIMDFKITLETLPPQIRHSTIKNSVKIKPSLLVAS